MYLQAWPDRRPAQWELRASPRCPLGSHCDSGPPWTAPPSLEGERPFLEAWRIRNRRGTLQQWPVSKSIHPQYRYKVSYVHKSTSCLSKSFALFSILLLHTCITYNFNLEWTGLVIPNGEKKDKYMTILQFTSTSKNHLMRLSTPFRHIWEFLDILQCFSLQYTQLVRLCRYEVQ